MEQCDEGCPAQAQDLLWPKAMLRRVILALVVKVLALGALWWWFFSPTHRPAASASAVAQHVLSSGSPAATKDRINE